MAEEFTEEEIREEIESGLLPLIRQLGSKTLGMDVDRDTILTSQEVFYQLDSEATQIVDLIRSACQDVIFDTETGEVDYDALELLRDEYKIGVFQYGDLQVGGEWRKAVVKTDFGQIVVQAHFEEGP